METVFNNIFLQTLPHHVSCKVRNFSTLQFFPTNRNILTCAAFANYSLEVGYYFGSNLIPFHIFLLSNEIKMNSDNRHVSSFYNALSSSCKCIIFLLLHFISKNVTVLFERKMGSCHIFWSNKWAKQNLWILHNPRNLAFLENADDINLIV